MDPRVLLRQQAAQGLGSYRKGRDTGPGPHWPHNPHVLEPRLQRRQWGAPDAPRQPTDMKVNGSKGCKHNPDTAFECSLADCTAEQGASQAPSLPFPG